MVAYFDPAGISTIVENIGSWTSLSKYKFDIVNLFEGKHTNGLELPPALELRHYDAILLHCTVAYNPINLRALDRSLKTKIRNFRGIKILMKQDEHFRTNEIVEYISSRHFDVLLTVADKSMIEHFYPPKKIGTKLKIYHALTGYISDEMLNQHFPPLSERPIDVGYRGSIQGWQLGRLAYEKREIGDRFSEVCRSQGLSFDISSRWEDRFSGQDWFQFLGRLKAVLGVESGSSIVDFDGTVEIACADYLKKNPAATFEDFQENILKKFDENVHYKTISPRHFEAAATKTVQILYEGHYSGIFKPDRHYISLKRDYSNIADVIEKLRDLEFCKRITETAYNEIVLNPKYHYKNFVTEVDELIGSAFTARNPK